MPTTGMAIDRRLPDVVTDNRRTESTVAYPMSTTSLLVTRLLLALVVLASSPAWAETGHAIDADTGAETWATLGHGLTVVAWRYLAV